MPKALSYFVLYSLPNKGHHSYNFHTKAKPRTALISGFFDSEVSLLLLPSLVSPVSVLSHLWNGSCMHCLYRY